MPVTTSYYIPRLSVVVPQLGVNRRPGEIGKQNPTPTTSLSSGGQATSPNGPRGLNISESVSIFKRDACGHLQDACANVPTSC